MTYRQKRKRYAMIGRGCIMAAQAITIALASYGALCIMLVM